MKPVTYLTNNQIILPSKSNLGEEESKGNALNATTGTKNSTDKTVKDLAQKCFMDDFFADDITDAGSIERDPRWNVALRTNEEDFSDDDTEDFLEDAFGPGFSDAGPIERDPRWNPSLREPE